MNVKNAKKNELYMNRRWLEGQYVANNRSAKQISDMFNVPVYEIIRYIELFNLEENPNKEEQQVRRLFKSEPKQMKPKKKVKKVKKVKKSNFKVKPKTNKYKSKTWLKTAFFDEGMTVTEMGVLCGVNEGVIRYWCKKYGLTRQARDAYRTKKQEAKYFGITQHPHKVYSPNMGQKYVQVNPYANVAQPRKAYSTIRNYETGLYDVVGVIEHEHGYHSLEHGMFLELSKEDASELAMNMNKSLGLRDSEANTIILSSLGWDKTVRQ